MKVNAFESNSQVHKRMRRREVASDEGLCFICPPHGGENARRRKPHGTQKRRYKQHRRGS